MSESITRQQIVQDLRENLGVRAGDRIAVHSSMKSLGHVEGGPIALIEALIEAVGGAAEGTVLMPCFTDALDVCDVLRTPCRLGLAPETFRTFPGVNLSQNHTHRVAVYGKDSAVIAGCHIGTTPLGVGSPFHELAKRGGYVVHIGCDFRSSSLIHVAEHLFPLPFHDAQITYPGYGKDITLVCADGSRVICPPRASPGDSAGFQVLQSEMDRYGLIRHGNVGEARCLKARGLDMLAMAVELLSKDPAALLCRKPNCPVCPPKRKIVEAWREHRKENPNEARSEHAARI